MRCVKKGNLSLNGTEVVSGEKVQCTGGTLYTRMSRLKVENAFGKALENVLAVIDQDVLRQAERGKVNQSSDDCFA
jgi:hypothetical protein